jgi:Mg2+/Co2+ transporter CorB
MELLQDASLTFCSPLFIKLKKLVASITQAIYKLMNINTTDYEQRVRNTNELRH